MKPSSLLPIALLVASAAGSLAEFPVPYNSETDLSVPLVSAAEAAASFEVPPGFKVGVFASEPDVQNPIGMSWDGRGRLWIAENYTYAERGKRFELGLRDRVLIFEDAKGDGRFSSRKVFTDDVQMLTSVEVGHGGVWLMCPPQLLFIADRNGDDKPDGPAEVMLDGFTLPPENHHNFANGLRFGPDGWLYGRCGASAPGDVGAPGTAKEDRIPLRGTMWRYHPKRKVFEALSSGCTNPWGHDWNEHGELFFINTVNGHLWHGITGAHFVRPHTIDPNPRIYATIEQHADHWHFDTAKDWTKSRDGAANALGGGHAHIGMMIYHGGNWPAEYRGHLFTWNMHGRRANQEILERHGSGYVGKHGADVFLAGDKWFRGMEMSCGPDGAVYALDWSDTGECHDSTGVHRTSGRIFKITHSDPKLVAPFDITKLNAEGLVELHTRRNEWFARQARMEISRRAAAQENAGGALNALQSQIVEAKDPVLRLNALWSHYAAAATDEAFLTGLLGDSDEHIRTWAIRLLTDHWPLDTCMSRRPPGRKESATETLASRFEALAKSDSSGLVRLALASTLQRLPVAQRAGIASALVARSEDAEDHNLPLLVWYGLIPVADSDPAALAKVTAVCEWPITRRFIARRLVEDIEKNPAPVSELLRIASTKPAAFQADILAGMTEGLSGWRKATKPPAWDSLTAKLSGSGDEAVRNRVRELNVVFGDGRALNEVKRIALDGKAELSVRKAALQTLIENRPPDLREVCEQLLGVRFLNAIAARGLSQFDDPAIGEKLAKSYRNFDASERSAVVETLLSRPVFAKALLNEVAAGKIARADVTPFHARQIRGFNDPVLAKQLAEVWGELREPAADKRALIAKLKGQLSPDELAKADPGAGRVVFNTLCASCHRLYGQGGVLGPDLTGAGRDNLDYLLDNIADPSAVVNADFRMSLATMKDGRVLGGVVTAKTARTVTLRTLTETTTIENADIKTLEQSPQSMMPEGLLEAVSATQVRDLIAYLMQRSQVRLPDAAQ